VKRPYRLYQNYLLDLLLLRYGRIEDGALELAVTRQERQERREEDRLMPGVQQEHPRA
jgi:hypothetical protein